jgi:pimeloyl-ACP methyl ester carboxylesterase
MPPFGVIEAGPDNQSAWVIALPTTKPHFGAAALIALILLTIPATARAAPASTQGDFAGPVDVDGRKLYVECKGTGSPTVILIAGYRNNAEIWTTPPGPGLTPVFDAVSGFTRVCTYDRPGTILDATHLSRSEPVPMPRTAEAVAYELHDLLDAANIQGPYVLVAHSLGGIFARLYASTYRNDVAGLVLVDAWPEAMPKLLGPEQWAAYLKLSDPAPPGLESYRDLERIDFGAASERMEQEAAQSPLYGLLLFVLSRAKPVALPPNVPAEFSQDAFEAAWRKGQDELAALLPDTRHVIANESDHYIQLEQPALVTDAVRQVVEAVRDPASWGEHAQ